MISLTSQPKLDSLLPVENTSSGSSGRSTIVFCRISNRTRLLISGAEPAAYSRRWPRDGGLYWESMSRRACGRRRKKTAENLGLQTFPSSHRTTHSQESKETSISSTPALFCNISIPDAGKGFWPNYSADCRPEELRHFSSRFKIGIRLGFLSRSG